MTQAEAELLSDGLRQNVGNLLKLKAAHDAWDAAGRPEGERPEVELDASHWATAEPTDKPEDDQFADPLLGQVPTRVVTPEERAAQLAKVNARASRHLYDRSPFRCLRNICQVALSSDVSCETARNMAWKMFDYFDFFVLFGPQADGWRGWLSTIFREQSGTFGQWVCEVPVVMVLNEKGNVELRPWVRK